MSEVATVAAWFLAGLLGWAAVVKLVRPRSTVAAFRALGAPVPPISSVALPVAELGMALALVAAPRAGGMGALLLLALFTGFLAVRIAQGTRAPCACFGVTTGRPVNVAVLGRNGLLMPVAAFVALNPPATPSVPAFVAVGAAVGAGAVVVALMEMKATAGRVWDNSLPRGPEALP